MDKGGKPVVMYHGTTVGFDAFDTGDSLGAHFGTAKAAQDRLETMSRWDDRAQRVLPVYLKLDNPYDLPDLDQWDQKEIIDLLAADDTLDWSKWPGGERGLREDVEYGGDYAPIQGFLKRNGYDGVVYTNREEGRRTIAGKAVMTDSYIVFDPDHIKSATGNVGTFDPKDPRFAYGVGAGVAAERALKDDE